MSGLTRKLVKPSDMLFEKVAGEIAAVWFEAGKNTPGMDMLRKKYKNDPRRYAAANLEKFIPKAVELCIDLLNKDHISAEMKEEIFEALQNRKDDPENITSDDIMQLPNLDMSKLGDLVGMKKEQHIDQSLKPKREKPINIKSRLLDSSGNPFKAQRH